MGLSAFLIFSFTLLITTESSLFAAGSFNISLEEAFGSKADEGQRVDVSKLLRSPSTKELGEFEAEIFPNFPALGLMSAQDEIQLLIQTPTFKDLAMLFKVLRKIVALGDSVTLLYDHRLTSETHWENRYLYRRIAVEGVVFRSSKGNVWPLTTLIENAAASSPEEAAEDALKTSRVRVMAPTPGLITQLCRGLLPFRKK